MKHNILLIISLLSINHVFSQGNVGIGTNTPVQILTVEKNGIGITQESGITKPVKIGFYTDSTSGGAYLQTHTKNNLNFATKNAQSQMVLDTLGNVGIGTLMVPAQKLDVSGAIKIGNTTNAVKGTIKYSQSDSSLDVYDNSRWKSMINNYDVVGADNNGAPVFFSSMLRNQFVNLPALTYTVKKTGAYLVILTADGYGIQEKNDIYNLSDNRNDYEGEVRLSRNNSPGSWYLYKKFFYTHVDANGDPTQDITWWYHSDDGEKSSILSFTAGDIIQVNAYIQQVIGASAPAQQQAWGSHVQVKYILLN